jgi:hypothetical protein
MGQPTSAEIGDSAVSHGPADVGSEIFGPEMYTCPEIFASEMCSRCVSGDFYSGVWTSDMYFGGITPR